jgi:hypothetical protein
VSEDVKALLGEARRLADSARHTGLFDGGAGAAALADAVDRLAAVCEVLADALAAKDVAVRVLPSRFGTGGEAGRV